MPGKSTGITKNQEQKTQGKIENRTPNPSLQPIQKLPENSSSSYVYGHFKFWDFQNKNVSKVAV